MTQLCDQALAPLDLRAIQLSMLREIDWLGPIALNPPAEAMAMGRATLGHNIRSLEMRGLVCLAAGAELRSRQVTPKGPVPLARAWKLRRSFRWHKRGLDSVRAMVDHKPCSRHRERTRWPSGPSHVPKREASLAASAPGPFETSADALSMAACGPNGDIRQHCWTSQFMGARPSRPLFPAAPPAGPCSRLRSGRARVRSPRRSCQTGRRRRSGCPAGRRS
jgi:hypothetical protein